MIRYSVFKIANKHFAVEISLVKEVFNLSRITVLPNVGALLAGVFNMRGIIVPLLDFRSALGIEKANTLTAGTAIIVDYQKNLLGLAVEKVLDFITVDESKIKSAAGQIPVQMNSFLQGVYDINTLGQVFMIDAQKMFRLSESIDLQ